MRAPRYRYRLTLQSKDGSELEAVATEHERLLDLGRQCTALGYHLIALRREDHPLVRPLP